MPIDPSIRSVLVIGSGPIVIGQACEFDYSGTQACRVLRAEGIRVILVNSNPATIMTDPEFADATYIEPITPEFIERIIIKEKPDAVLATLGGQTALNAAMGMHAAGILERHGVRLIGADVEAISRGENRELFRAIVEKVGGESARSIICHTMDDVVSAASTLGFPCVIRPSFTMGGLGSGIAYDEESLQQIAGAGLRHSPTSEVLIEESIIGWKEFELEVMRDKIDNVVIVCSIENIDPMGVHTGDSITVAPALTLTDVEYQRLRDLSIDIIREVGVDTGGCNIQYAVNPENGRIIVIEMNPRVSRSSALASKATGFPIAKIATKLAIGYTLDEIKNDITQVTPASFEPTLDYIVVKAPRFAFEKFQDADARLTTTMKSVGEAMAIGRSFPEALMKVLRSLERKEAIFKFPANLDSIDIDSLLVAIATPTEYRLQEVQTLLWAGIDAEKVYQICKIDRWYLKQIQEINEAARVISEPGELSIDLVRFAKSFGFSDAQIGLLRNVSEEDVRKARQHFDVHPVYKTVDTCAAEFQAHTPYHYSSYEEESEVLPRTRPAVIILGSGPNRIGQGIEFDYSCVHASFTLREADFETIMINCNPETVSTDYDTSDRLYFEPLTLEDVLEVIHAESLAGPVLGVITQLGGQTPLGLAAGLKAAGVNILGTSPEAINLAEERGAFGELLLQRNLTAPEFGMAASQEEAILIAQRIGYPVLVRPSFVLGGRGMEIVYDDESLSSFISRATDITPDRPVLVDRFLDSAIELDVDALYDGHELFLGGIMEHIEEAGIHSGDSACVLPAMTITETMRDEVRSATLSIAEGVGVRGLINIQFAVAENKLYVLEANPRASRTVPFVSKATGVPLAKAAARISVGSTISELREVGLLPVNERHVPKGVSVKEAVLPWNRFRRRDGRGVDAVLGPEMRSTGEVMGISKDFGGAYAKSQISSFGPLPKSGSVFISLADKDKSSGILPARALIEMGFKLFATAGTASFLESHQVHTALVRKHSDGPGEFGERTIVEILNSGEIDLVINTPVGRGTRADGWAIRTAAVQRSIPIITTTPGFSAAVAGIKSLRDGELDLASLQEWLA
ncbi:MAG: carbamoyl-phosphate synthase large subunit [Actinobacteria bacterium]|uniref:Carbamoyl phosphate synthase arginine-specific large chain, chloroplastic n=2 Tax=freshwater metagenome TaxID=449393 RepID=A0A6J6HPF5_9ZZZZ|nr:carbamoyl-phosphate synthase large subunit [Actinomycetota bacterium]